MIALWCAHLSYDFVGYIFACSFFLRLEATLFTGFSALRGNCIPPPKKPWIYLLEGGPLVVQASPPPQVSVLGTHLDQCASWRCCERLRSASVNFFWRLSTHLPISQWVIYEYTRPHHTECSAVFDPKQHDPHAPPSLFTLSHPNLIPFLFPWIKNVLKGKHFATVEEVEWKTAEALKGIILLWCHFMWFSSCFLYLE